MKALLIYFMWTVTHPFHVSVCDIVHNEKRRSDPDQLSDFLRTTLKIR